MTTEYSIQKMVSDGTLSTIALGIQYLQRNDIYMRIAGEETPQSGAPSGYTWSFVNNTTLKILPVVPNGVEVVVYRRTDIDAMYNIYSQNAQFDEATIDENNQQLLYIAQEYLEQGIPGAGVDTLEFVRDDGTYTYYRIKRTDGSYSDEFAVPSASTSTKVLTRESLRRSYAEAGYNLVAGSFEAGGTVAYATDVLLYEATGIAYLWLGAVPKVVPPASSPATTGGLGTNGWLDIGDASLRGDLAATGGSSIIYDAKSTVAPGNVAKFGDTSGVATLSVPDAPTKRLLLNKTCSYPDDFTVLQVNRSANYTGGTVGHVGSALRAQTNVSPTANGSFEWTALFVMDNNAPNNPSGGGPGSGVSPQNVAMYGQAIKRNTSATWAGCLEIRDSQAPANGAAIGLEITCVADGADSVIPQRIGSHVTLIDGVPIGQDVEWGRAYWADAVSVPGGGRFRIGYDYTGGVGDAVFSATATTNTNASLIKDKSTLAVGINLTQATYTTNRAIHLKMGQRIALNEDATQTLRGSAAGPVFEGRLNLTGSFAVPSAGNTTSSAAAGTSGAAPSQVAGYITILIDGVTKKIPFYN